MTLNWYGMNGEDYIHYSEKGNIPISMFLERFHQVFDILEDVILFMRNISRKRSSGVLKELT